MNIEYIIDTKNDKILIKATDENNKNLSCSVEIDIDSNQETFFEAYKILREEYNNNIKYYREKLLHETMFEEILVKEIDKIKKPISSEDHEKRMNLMKTATALADKANKLIKKALEIKKEALKL